jgi:hypothetical protein
MDEKNNNRNFLEFVSLMLIVVFLVGIFIKFLFF